MARDIINSLRFKCWITTKEKRVVVIDYDGLFCVFPFRKRGRRLFINSQTSKSSRKQVLFRLWWICT